MPAPARTCEQIGSPRNPDSLQCPTSGSGKGKRERGGSVPASPCCRRRHRRASGTPAPSPGLGLGEVCPRPEPPAPSIQPDLRGRGAGGCGGDERAGSVAGGAASRMEGSRRPRRRAGGLGFGEGSAARAQGEGLVLRGSVGESRRRREGTRLRTGRTWPRQSGLVHWMRMRMRCRIERSGPSVRLPAASLTSTNEPAFC